MRIGFDASQTGTGRDGCGWYARDLLEHLTAIDAANEYVVYPTFGDWYWSPSGGTDTCLPRRANCRRGLRHRSLAAMQAFWQHPPDDWQEQLGSPDLIHANNYYCPTGLRQTRAVFTLYDLGFLHNPDWTDEANRIACFTGAFRASAYADAVLAISHFTRADFLSQFPHYPADRVFVASPASRFDPARAAARPNRLAHLDRDGFWLHVGTIGPRKNIDQLLAAFAEVLRADKRRRRLVLAGATDRSATEWQRRARELDIDGALHVTDYVDDATLQWMYENCFALVCSSHFEGFCMPVLEAMSLGAAVIATDTSAIPEVIGEAGLLVDAGDSAAMARAMMNLMADEPRRAAVRSAARARADVFSWRRTAQAVLDCYQTTASRPRLYDGGEDRVYDPSTGA